MKGFAARVNASLNLLSHGGLSEASQSLQTRPGRSPRLALSSYEARRVKGGSLTALRV